METNNSQFSILNSQLIKVAIIDDHKMFVEGLTRIINESGVAQIVGTAHSIADSAYLFLERQVEVLLLDINLPDGDGVDYCKQIKAQYPDLKILALTSFGEYAVINRMLENGASGYVLKNAMSEEIIKGIEVVAAGEKFLCDEVNLLLKKQAGNAIILTGKERELLRLISEGFINTEIAEKMFLGVETINSYRKNLLFKLNARNTAVLVKMAHDEKLV